MRRTVPTPVSLSLSLYLEPLPVSYDKSSLRSDVYFAVNYITGKSIPIPQTGNCAQKTAPSGFSPDSAVLSVSRNCVLTCMAAILAVLNSYLFMQDQQRMPSSIIHSTKSDASSDVKCFFRELPAGEYTVSFSMVKKDFLTDESAVSPLNTAFPLDISHSPAFCFLSGAAHRHQLY